MQYNTPLNISDTASLDVILLTRDLIKFNTVNPPGNEADIAEFVGAILTENGFRVGFTKNRGKAMGIAYLGIGVGGAIVPLLATILESKLGWQNALTILRVLIIIIAFPLSYFIRDSSKARVKTETVEVEVAIPMKKILKNPNFYLLAFGSMCSIGAVGRHGAALKTLFA